MVEFWVSKLSKYREYLYFRKIWKPVLFVAEVVKDLQAFYIYSTIIYFSRVARASCFDQDWLLEKGLTVLTGFFWVGGPTFFNFIDCSTTVGTQLLYT